MTCYTYTESLTWGNNALSDLSEEDDEKELVIDLDAETEEEDEAHGVASNEVPKIETGASTSDEGAAGTIAKI